ncbi:hypothetical protein ACIA8G_12530 [Lentzea sp. NPDC051213]|uniref:hypothetical protein n=1 Tax=Lentzea sp. NPDC051213 TaxID=3364126 RepID=UPI0037AE472C
MAEVEVHVTGLLTPAAPRPRISVSVEAIGLTLAGTDVASSARPGVALAGTDVASSARPGAAPAGTDVVASRRLGPTPTDQAVAAAAVDLLERTADEARQAGVRLQSTVADVVDRGARQVRVLARAETIGGPVLLGTESADHRTATLPFAELGRLPAALSPATDARDLPIVLRPGVAAVLIAGAVFSLTSARGRENARQLAGKRVLPGLTLTEADRTLVDAGVLVASDEAPQRIWDHERQSYVEDPLTRAGMRGPEAPLPQDFVELVWCVEGLQRYHADGTVRLQCLAKTGDEWSVRTLVGKPIRLLRHVTAVHGPLTTVFTDSVVTTQSLVLTSARTIEGKGNGRIIEE